MKTICILAVMLSSIPYAQAYPVFQETQSEHLVAPPKAPCETHGGFSQLKANYQANSRVVNIHYFCKDGSMEVRVVPVRDPSQYNKLSNLRRISI